MSSSTETYASATAELLRALAAALPVEIAEVLLPALRLRAATGRVAVELLAAISAQQDPVTCPVVLTAYRVTRQGDAIQVEIEGYAKSAQKSGTDAVLHDFELGLRKRYPPIVSVQQLPKPLSTDNQPFFYRIAVKDR